MIGRKGCGVIESRKLKSVIAKINGHCILREVKVLIDF